MLNVRSGLIMTLVVALVSVGQITNTIYVPAMALMAHSLHVYPESIEALMALYLFPYGLSQFIYGPLSDHYGRRPIVLVGLVIFAMGSLVVTFAPNYNYLLLGSLIQGCGTGVCGVMARTVMRDCYTDHKLQKANSIIAVALIFAPLAAPVVGGFLATKFGWRYMFLFLLGFGVMVALVEYYLFPETNIAAKERKYMEKGRLIRAYKTVLATRIFWAYMLTLTLTFAGFSVFEASAGVIFGKILHIQPDVASLLFVVPLPGYMVGCYLAGYLNRFFTIRIIMLLGIVTLALGVLTLAIPAFMLIDNVWVILIPITLYMFGAGIIFPTATTGATNPLGHQAGIAGAVLGGVQNMVAGLSVLLFSMVIQTSQRPLAIMLIVTTVLVALIYITLLAKDKSSF